MKYVGFGQKSLVSIIGVKHNNRRNKWNCLESYRNVAYENVWHGIVVNCRVMFVVASMQSLLCGPL